jgi:Tfp pilus assembly protein PilX
MPADRMKPVRVASPRRRAHGRRGSTYLMVLGLAMIVTICGLGALAVGRIQLRAAAESQDWLEAQTLAFSAAEHAVARIKETSNWRTAFNGVTTTQSLGRGTFQWSLADESDGDLTDEDSDPVVLLASATVNRASYSLKVDLAMTALALEALSTCVTVAQKVDVKNGDSLTITGAPLSCNDDVKNSGTIYGDVHAGRITAHGTIEGTVVNPAPAKALPDSGVFDSYVALATTISPGGGKDLKIEEVVLSPTSNPWGAPNADGVYYIDTGNKDLIIKKARIYGTLVIRSGSRKVKLEDVVFLKNYREDYPALIVDGNVEMKYKSATKVLSESECDTNFNPLGTPYDDEWDADESDTYPNEVQGLVHVTGDLKMKETARVRGVVIAEDQFVVEGDNEIIHDPSIPANPPVGYGSDGDSEPRITSWSRSVQ